VGHYIQCKREESLLLSERHCSIPISIYDEKRREKMNDKPKDRTTMWMSIVAFVLVLMIAYVLGAMIFMIFAGYSITPIVFYLLSLVFLAIVLRWIMREKRGYKPKDRTTMWMSIVALILVLISTLGVMIYVIVTGEDGIGALFCLLCLVFLAVALHWKTVGGVFFVLLGLLFVYSGVRDVISGSYDTLLEQIYLVWVALLPFIAGLLFLAIWRRRKAKLLAGSD
jgi:MFS family permease